MGARKMFRALKNLFQMFEVGKCANCKRQTANEVFCDECQARVNELKKAGQK